MCVPKAWGQAPQEGSGEVLRWRRESPAAHLPQHAFELFPPFSFLFLFLFLLGSSFFLDSLPSHCPVGILLPAQAQTSLQVAQLTTGRQAGEESPSFPTPDSLLLTHGKKASTYMLENFPPIGRMLMEGGNIHIYNTDIYSHGDRGHAPAILN